MKKQLLSILIMASASSLFGMEGDRSLNPFCIPDVGVHILKCLLESTNTNEAVKTITSLALSEKAAYNIFRLPTITRECIKLLCKASWDGRCFSQNIFKKLAPLLDKNEYACFQKSLNEAPLLIGNFEECAKSNEWGKALSAVKGLEQESLGSYLALYYWDSTYFDMPVQKTLLIYAVELDAPDEIIETLIKWGSILTKFPKATLPPCVIISKKLVTITEQYEKTCLQDGVDSETSLGLDFCIQKLKHRIELLIKSGASLNDYYYSKGLFNGAENPTLEVVTPLRLAVFGNNLKLLNYLLSKDSHHHDCFNWAFSAALSGFKENKISQDIIETLVNYYPESNNSFHPFMIMLCEEQNKTFKEKLMSLFPLFLDNIKFDINAIKNNLTVLDIASQLPNGNEAIVEMLVQKGAKVTEEKSNDNKKVFDLANKMNTLLRTNWQDKASFEAGLSTFLQEVKDALCSSKSKKAYENLVIFSLSCAFQLFLVHQESKEFWRFIAAQKSFSLPMESGDYTCSAFKFIVEAVKQVSAVLPPSEKDRMLQTAQALTTFLAQEGAKDTITGTEKSAAEMAESLGMVELAQHIRKTLEGEGKI